MKRELREKIIRAREFLGKRLYAPGDFTDEEYDRMGDTMSDSFEGYRMLEWGLGTADYDSRRSFFTLELKSYSDISLIVADGSDINSLAVLCPSNSISPPISSYMKNGIFKVLGNIGLVAVIRLMRYNERLIGIRTSLVGKSPWYLYFLGTRKDSQGRGLGGRLMEEITAYMDLIGEDVYIETNEVSNVDFYAKYDFELLDEFTQADFKGYCLYRRHKEK